ncbi:MAG: pyrroline-5-carboxylate reductase [Clostridiales bacterium]|jgi:pyrroline-5-carboxylate reductase|nr:pyrroline-5-carboxylate reductase [Clostridiales bacterium]MDR2752397.1 pyrroline-5-carboxylate reductase [Clostridiales bacterium]
MNYGFIGCGAMSGAILQGGIDSGFFNPSQTYVYEKNGALAKERADKFNVRLCKSETEVIDQSESVIIGVKPIDLPNLLPYLGPYLAMHKTLAISIAGGITLEKLNSLLGMEVATVRVMPNLNCGILQGAAAICANEFTTPSQKQEVLNLFNSIGMAIELEEKLFSPFTAIAGCAPAFVYLFADSLARGAVKLGMSKKQALQVASAAIAGSANNILVSKEHPWELIDRVCSPGGSTIEGVTHLLDNGFESAVIGAVVASAMKDKGMGK